MLHKYQKEIQDLLVRLEKELDDNLKEIFDDYLDSNFTIIVGTNTRYLEIKIDLKLDWDESVGIFITCYPDKESRIQVLRPFNTRAGYMNAHKEEGLTDKISKFLKIIETY